LAKWVLAFGAGKGGGRMLSGRTDRELNGRRK